MAIAAGQQGVAKKPNSNKRDCRKLGIGTKSSLSGNRTFQALALAVRQAVSGPDENYLFYHAN